MACGKGKVIQLSTLHDSTNTVTCNTYNSLHISTFNQITDKDFQITACGEVNNNPSFYLSGLDKFLQYKLTI